jgi:hypothetical protein
MKLLVSVTVIVDSAVIRLLLTEALYSTAMKDEMGI